MHALPMPYMGTLCCSVFSECSSLGVGRTQTRGRFHIVYLSEDDGSTCFYHHIVVHELMHAIGLDHEHSRSDRKEFVDVDLNNVDKGNFSRTGIDRSI